MNNEKILELINNLFQISSSTLNLKQLLNLIMDITLNYLKAEVGNIVLMNKKTGLFYSDVNFGMSLEVIKNLQYGNEKLLNRIMKNKIPLIIRDYHKQHKLKKPITIQSILCSPLVTKGKALGAIFLVNKYIDNSITNFSRDDLEILRIINTNIASSIEKAQLYEEVLDLKNFNDSIINSISTGVITTDLEGGVLSINSSARFILNLSDDSLQKNIRDIVDKLDNRKFLMNALKNKENILNVESILSLRDGTEKILNISISILNNLASEIIGFTISLDDITEKKYLENQVLRNDQLAALGELSAGIAHEIKNPLTSIKGFSEILHKKLDDKEFLVKYSLIIPKEVERLNTIIEGMLQFSRPKSKKIERCSLEKVIRSARDLMNYEFKKNNINFVMNLTPLSDSYCDVSQMEQVFINFFLNAVQAMEKGGTIAIKNKVMVKKSPSKLFFEYNTIYISDTGRGIAEKNLPRLFNPFFTTRTNGTGLGLSISHKIVTEHKGFIEVFSKVNEGTTFVIHIPTVNN